MLMCVVGEPYNDLPASDLPTLSLQYTHTHVAMACILIHMIMGNLRLSQSHVSSSPEGLGGEREREREREFNQIMWYLLISFISIQCGPG